MQRPRGLHHLAMTLMFAGSPALLVAACASSGDAGATDAVESAVDAGDTAASEPIDALPEGSYEACAARYTGFDTCCSYDAANGTWTFSDAPCGGATQCVSDVDCPAGWRERMDPYTACFCEPLRTDASCASGVQAVAAGESCPDGGFRCPAVYPDDGSGTCASCPCDERSGTRALAGTPVCPEGAARAGCPCAASDGDCCLDIGVGLACNEGTWQAFSDCPCGGAPGGCSEPLAPYCPGD